jgi:aldehyde:ferredoxin oxidoreductase
MTGGFTGKMLWIDLTKETIKEEEIDEQIFRDFIGGYGLGIRFLYERMKPKVDALGPDNILGFVTGVCTGAGVPGSGRYMIVTKSPMTGTWAESNSGGTFGPDMKTGGYDAFFFTGISPRPVYLLVKDGKASLQDATKYWSKDTYETDDLMHKDLGDNKIKIACIGPAGEAKSLLAGIVNEKGRIAARSGVGAVMGSKRLKAVAVKGGAVKIAIGNPDKLRVAREKFVADIKSSDFKKGLSAAGTGGGTSFLVSIGDSPIKNWQVAGTESMPTANKLDSTNMDKYKKESYGCFACPIRCGAIIEQKEGPFAIPEEMHRPEYETLAALGGLCLNDNLEGVIKANDICNRTGMDTISAGGSLAYAMECYDKGIITEIDTDGIDLKWGNAEGIIAMLEKMGKREGLGAVLADGLAVAVQKLGKATEEFAIGVRGRSLPMHDPRNAPGMGTQYFADANVGNHNDTQALCVLEAGMPLGNDLVLQVPNSPVYGEYDKKGPAYTLGAECHQLLNCAGLCSLYFLNSPMPPVTELIEGVIGWDFDWPKALKAARRILTLRQAFNVREGLTPDKFDLPKRVKQPHTVGPAVGQKIDFNACRDSYYEDIGWDHKTGKPYRKTLEELGLVELTKDLA